MRRFIQVGYIAVTEGRQKTGSIEIGPQGPAGSVLKIDCHQQQLYRGTMQKVIVLLAMIFVALSVQGATISTPASQDVRTAASPVPRLHTSVLSYSFYL